MKKTLSRFIFFIVSQAFLGLLSCDSKNNQHSENSRDIMSIKVYENVQESVLSSEIMHDVEYITLESDSNSIIGRIDKFIATDEFIFVMDAEQSKRILQFGAHGNFIRVIGNSGRGPGEYQRLVDFCVCNITQRIFVLDVKRKIIVYNQHGGLIKEMKLDQGDPLSSRILIHNEDLYFYTGRGENYSSRFSLLKLNSEGKEVDGYMPFENAPNYSVTFNSPIYTSDGNLKFFDPFDGILLINEQNQFTPEYHLDFNNKGIPIGVLCDFNKYVENLQHYSLTDRYFIEGDSHIYYLIVDKMAYKHGFFSKTTGNSILTNSIINDDHIFRSPELFHNDFFYTLIEPYWLYDEAEKYKHLIENNSVEKNGNPLVMKYKIKEFIESDLNQ